MDDKLKKRKALVVTPSFHFPPTGAEQQDRAAGFRQLLNLGYEVKVIAKLSEWRSAESAAAVAKGLGIEVIPVSYKYSNRTLALGDKLKQILLKLKNPLLLDGAALEYDEPEIKKVLEREIKEWRPDFVWFDYTYLWPLYKIVKKEKIPIITRSINFEPLHFLQEDGYSPINLIKSIPKFISEFISTRKSNHIFAITPKEEKIYRALGARGASTLPLRSLPDFLKTSHTVKNKIFFNVLFMGSTYNVSHNKKALKFIIKSIAPHMNKHYPGQFTFYISGSKFPEKYKKYLSGNIIYKGYLDKEEFERLWSSTDIALIPSLFGAGMQQKIFEPLCRGIPTITSERGIAGYPFKNKKSVYFAKTKEDFISCLLELRDFSIRKKISEESIKITQKIFSQETLDLIIERAIENAI